MLYSFLRLYSESSIYPDGVSRLSVSNVDAASSLQKFLELSITFPLCPGVVNSVRCLDINFFTPV